MKILLTFWTNFLSQERDEEILELKAALQETKQKLESLDTQQKDSELSVRRSKRVATSSGLQQELADTKARLEQCQKELNSTSAGTAAMLHWSWTVLRDLCAGLETFFRVHWIQTPSKHLNCRWQE